jgi:hypothetical protein
MGEVEYELPSLTADYNQAKAATAQQVGEQMTLNEAITFALRE